MIELQSSRLMLDAAKELDRATEQIEQYENFIKWLNSKPEYEHVYQQYLSQKKNNRNGTST